MNFKDSKELVKVLDEKEASLGFIGKGLLFIFFPVIVGFLYVFLFFAFLYIWLTIPFTRIRIKGKKSNTNPTTLEV